MMNEAKSDEKCSPPCGESKDGNSGAVSSNSVVNDAAHNDNTSNQNKSIASSSSPVPPPIRYEWFQTSETVVITLFVKDPDPTDTKVNVNERWLRVEFRTKVGLMYNVEIHSLFAGIDQDGLLVSVRPAKIEMKVMKSESGRRWTTLVSGSENRISSDFVSKEGVRYLEIGTRTSNSEQSVNKTDSESRSPHDQHSQARTNAMKSAEGEIEQSKLMYPTSSRTGVKDWDKIVSDLTKSSKDVKKSKDTNERLSSSAAPAEGSKLPSRKSSSTLENEDHSDSSGDQPLIDGDSDDDHSEADEVSGFFKKLYSKASPDTRRAMIKSFTESNGTALSTNWDDVKKGPVPVAPPDGMQAKKW